MERKNLSSIITVFMIIGRSGRLKIQSPTEQASSENIGRGRSKQIPGAGKEKVITCKAISLLLISLLLECYVKSVYITFVVISHLFQSTHMICFRL